MGKVAAGDFILISLSRSRPLATTCSKLYLYRNYSVLAVGFAEALHLPDPAGCCKSTVMIPTTIRAVHCLPGVQSVLVNSLMGYIVVVVVWLLNALALCKQSDPWKGGQRELTVVLKPPSPPEQIKIRQQPWKLL